MKLFVISFFLLVNLFMSVSINATALLNSEEYGFTIRFGFVHNGEFFFERRYLSCPPETEFPEFSPLKLYRHRPEIEIKSKQDIERWIEKYMAEYEREAEFSIYRRFGHYKRRLKQYLLELKSERDPERWMEKYEDLMHEYRRIEMEINQQASESFSMATCQEEAPENREGDDDFSRRRRDAFISTCVGFVRYCNHRSFYVYTNDEIDAAIEMLEKGITHNAEQIKHQEKALVKNINSLKATVISEVENDLIPQFSILMDKIADLEAKINQLEQENRQKDIEMTILKEAVAKENQ
jgi:hypothetical protein